MNRSMNNDEQQKNSEEETRRIIDFVRREDVLREDINRFYKTYRPVATGLILGESHE
jgi:hypothetical protein